MVLIIHTIWRIHEDLFRIYETLGFRVKYLPLKNIHIVEARQAIKSIDPLFIHANYARSPAFAAFLSKKPYIIYAHGSDLRISFRKDPIRNIARRFALKKASWIWVSTRDIIGNAKQLAGEKKVSWLPVPVNEEIFRPKKSQVDWKQGHEIAIFMPSRIDYYTKRNLVALKAIKESDLDIIFHYIAHGKDLADFESRVKKWKVTTVKHKIMSQSDMVQGYNAVDIIIDQFSDYGSYGMVTVEALLCGKPVITAPCDAPVYAAMTPKEFIERITEIIYKKTDSEKLRNWAIMRHGHSSTIIRMKQVFKKIGFL